MSIGIQILNSENTLKLRKVKKYLLEEQYTKLHLSGVTIHTSYQEKHPDFNNEVDKLKKICEQRIIDLEE